MAAMRRKRTLQSRQIRRHGERSMPQAHREEPTFAADAATKHHRTEEMRDKASFHCTRSKVGFAEAGQKRSFSPVT